jgi:membrane associated rhomboid family serine protease
LSVDAP